MGLFNAGRAYWITTQYRPTNEADIPARSSVADRILVIPTDAPPDAATQDALEIVLGSGAARGRRSDQRSIPRLPR